MTNFSGTPSGVITRERVLLWGPALLGGVLAALAGGLLLLPAWQRLQQVERQLEDLKGQQQQLPLLRRQLSVIDERHTQAELRQRRILELIQGSGDLRTFLAQLSLEARASGVQLEGYEPISAVAPAPAEGAGSAGGAKAGKPAAAVAPAVAPDPLQGPGLNKTSLLLRARGRGPQLQQFLRRLERLSLLVVQSDLAVKVEPPESTAAGKPAAARANDALLSLTLSLYRPDSAPAAVKP
jgi:type IV pilus assembly protein PilO